MTAAKSSSKEIQERDSGKRFRKEMQERPVGNIQ
jgi:hypothetical protein